MINRDCRLRADKSTSNEKSRVRTSSPPADQTGGEAAARNQLARAELSDPPQTTRQAEDAQSADN